jgi:hypothetical protein
MDSRRRSLFLAIAFLLGAMLFFPSAAMAQRAPNPPDVATGCAGCGACGLFGLLVFVALIAVEVFILVWVARDAKARGMDNAVMWIILIVFTHVIGLLVYIFARPQGNLIQCAHCHNKRMEASRTCPHCGNP